MEMPRRIIAAAAQLLRPAGWCVLEHAESQAEDMQEQMRSSGFEQVQLHQDLTGRPRSTSGVLA